jgi:hypothetical protein
MRYEIVLEADIVSKKNAYAPRKGGGFRKPEWIKNVEKDAISQIPADLWGLEMMHPHMVFWFNLPSKSFALDRDGAATTILDFLVRTKVLKDDNCRNCNGVVMFMPAIKSDSKKFVVWLYPNDTDLTEIYKDIENELKQDAV